MNNNVYYMYEVYTYKYVYSISIYMCYIYIYILWIPQFQLSHCQLQGTHIYMCGCTGLRIDQGVAGGTKTSPVPVGRAIGVAGSGGPHNWLVSPSGGGIPIGSGGPIELGGGLTPATSLILVAELRLTATSWSWRRIRSSGSEWDPGMDGSAGDSQHPATGGQTGGNQLPWHLIPPFNLAIPTSTTTHVDWNSWPTFGQWSTWRNWHPEHASFVKELHSRKSSDWTLRSWRFKPLTASSWSYRPLEEYGANRNWRPSMNVLRGLFMEQSRRVMKRIRATWLVMRYSSRSWSTWAQLWRRCEPMSWFVTLDCWLKTKRRSS